MLVYTTSAHLSLNAVIVIMSPRSTSSPLQARRTIIQNNSYLVLIAYNRRVLDEQSALSRYPVLRTPPRENKGDYSTALQM
jgi:hypothetical protein